MPLERTKMKSKTGKTNIALVLIVLLAAFLRLWGIKHGFPFIFHPDEPTVIRSALGVRFDPNPKHFDWPHLYIYLNYFLYMIFAKFRSFTVDIGLRDKAAVWFPLMWDEKIVFYYLTRCFSAILGALTVIPVYMTAKNLFGKKVGLFSALAFALMPYHVRHSHYSLVDVPMVFFLSWGMYFSSLIMKSRDLKNYIFSGLFIGLAASTKYNGGLSALMVPVAHFVRVFSQRRSIGDKEDKSSAKEGQKPKIIDFKGVLYIFLSGLSAILGFLAGTPYALLDFKTFSRTDGPQGAFWQFTNVGSVTFPEHIRAFFGDIFGQLASDTGYTIMAVYVLGFIFLIYKLIKKKTDQKNLFPVFFYIISLFLIWYVSGFEKSRSHYYFVFYPFAAVIFGYFVSCVSCKMETKKKLLGIFSSVALFSLPAVFSFIQAYSFHRGDTRVDLYKWLQNNYRMGEVTVYNDSAVRDVLGYVGVESVKGLDSVEEYERALVVILDPGEDEKKFFKNRGSRLEKVMDFDNRLKLGPDIEVYSYVDLKEVK